MAHNTRSNALWNKHQAIRKEQEEELQKLANEEFQPGTKVKWIYTFKVGGEAVWRRGAVVRVHDFCRVECRIGNSRSTHIIYSHSLEFDN